MQENETMDMSTFIDLVKTLSPFEVKDKLIKLAKNTQERSAFSFLNAGRGNPNWIAATPRQAFFSLGQFAVEEAQLTVKEGDLAGLPYKEGMMERFKSYAGKHHDTPGIKLLERIVNYGVNKHQFDPDEWIYELVDGIIGDHYPIPDRMLKYIEEVVYDYLIKEMSGRLPNSKLHDLFAVEGGTAAMCYIFDTLSANHLLVPKDHIALMVPIFTPYLEIPQLSRYEFQVTYIHADVTNEDNRHTWQYSKEEFDKLNNPDIKALFVVNPSNPPSVAIDDEGILRLKTLIKEKHPDLMIITDDVYGTFTDNFKSLMTEIPYNTIGVYSYSKYFGVTGWRLGVIAVAIDNVFDKLLKELPTVAREDVVKRYSSLTENPNQIKFIDRIVADSRQVALNHTAGLSTPQQVQMAIFSIFALLDEQNIYKEQTKALCRRRLELLYKHLDLPLYVQPHTTAYYREIDLLVWARLKYGEDLVDYMKSHYAPEDMIYRLAKDYAIVLLNGNGFKGPDWSVRISLANLPDEAYENIGKAINDIFISYVLAWKQNK